MNSKAVVSNITIFPVKSLDGLSLEKAQVGNGGCLRHDRMFAIKDLNKKYVNGKKNALVHLLRMQMDLSQNNISFRHETETDWHHFSLDDKQDRIDEYLSSFFNMPVNLHKNTTGRFLDVPDKSGVTVISSASLRTVSGWFNQMEMEETRTRFRANIEITNVPAFWEDKLFFSDETAIEFTIGDVHVFGMAPRARCIVPTRHPLKGDAIQGFQKSFANHRTASLPEWSSLENYSHAYYLSVDCYLPATEVGKWICVGDELKIIGKKSFTTFTTL